MKFLTNNESEYKRIFNNGKRKLWSQNTALHEWNKIMQEIDKDYKGVNVNDILAKYI